MRKFLLIAVAGAAMSMAALPSASLAKPTGDKCAPGNNNPSYCERCPDSTVANQNTSNLGAAAALAAADAMTASTTSISFTFTPVSCGTFHVELYFAVPFDHHLKYIGVSVGVAAVKAGVPVTITLPLSDFGRDFKAHQAAHHDRLNLEVVTTMVNKHGGNKATTSLFGHISF